MAPLEKTGSFTFERATTSPTIGVWITPSLGETTVPVTASSVKRSVSASVIAPAASSTSSS